MNKSRNISLIICLFVCVITHATNKVYLIHGYASLGLELENIHKSIKNEGFESEIYVYPSLSKDIDSVGVELFRKIQKENYDTVSFVTHSMGALVVRSLYEHIDSLSSFPFIYRIVMIAPPNNGSPVADFFAQFSFMKFIVGPNVKNLTSNSVTGAKKYPIPTCEVGLIAGSYGRKRGFNIFVKGDNDGVLLPEQTKMGIEKDVAFVKSWHVGLLYNKIVKKYVISFLINGKFKPAVK
ncbi:MAG: alpha/beta hydrolase [Paludibacter sp.]|nr:alpha/beta hydrolase [Paludibacter sp.]